LWRTTETRKHESTGTRNRAEATSLLNARNESIRQPHLNLQIAKAYLAGTDSGVASRTWQQALDLTSALKADEINNDPSANCYLLKAIAEVQGAAGDQAGAQQTLASARKAADLIQEPRLWARCSVGLVNWKP